MYRKYGMVNVVTIVFLLYFCIYAISPLSFSINQSVISKSNAHNYRGLNVFVIQLILDKVVSRDASADEARENAGVLLVKRVRAVFRDCNIAVVRLIEVFCGINLFASCILLSFISTLRLTLFSCRSSIWEDRVGMKAFPGFRSLTSGLSPPSPLS